MPRTYSLFTCQICQWSGKQRWKKHLHDAHHLSYHEYYDQCLKQEQDGMCRECTQPTSFDAVHYCYRIFCSTSCRSRHHAAQTKISPEYRHSIRAMQKMKNPKETCGTPRGSPTHYKGIKFRSSWEAKFAKKLDEHETPWQFEPKTFRLHNGRHYTPDFYLPETKEFIEVKPTRFLSVALRKKRWLLETYPHLQLRIVTEKDCPYFLDYSSSPKRPQRSRASSFHASHWRKSPITSRRKRRRFFS